jgi:hypothetical protein
MDDPLPGERVSVTREPTEAELDTEGESFMNAMSTLGRRR